MMWVNDTLPPRARARWLLMTVRLSQSSFTGTERTEVAVGTLSETSMLAAVRMGAPRSTAYVGWSLARAGAGAAGRAVGVATGVAAAGTAGAAGVWAAGVWAAGADGCAGAVGSAAAGALPLGTPLGPPGAPCVLKYSRHAGSSPAGFDLYSSYISSTSHSLAPKSSSGWVSCDSGTAWIASS